tara:strand:+ start:162 stop:470 length:309 start_codon:yes stop_codon:yes gene_type:complete
MAKKINTKTEIKKLLDKTEIDDKLLSIVKNLLSKTDVDDKLIGAYSNAKESGLLDKVKGYIKDYGGYVLAVGAGCLFGTNTTAGFIFLLVSAVWAYKLNCKK